jgi:cytochrome b561
MQFKNTLNSYGFTAKTIHWLVFFLFVFMFITAEIMTDMDRGETRGMLYGWHKSTGMLLLVIVGLRILWRFANITPLLPADMKPFEKKLAHLGHFALYVCMVTMPVSGYVMSMAGGHDFAFYGLVDVPNILALDKELSKLAKEVHEICAWVIYFLVPLHITAALFHHFVRKDDVLLKMLPKRK